MVQLQPLHQMLQLARWLAQSAALRFSAQY
jgi:uncharacterized integral membrane protein